MGKYSIDSFEPYTLMKLRPAMKAPGCGSYTLLEVSQAELEPEKGVRLAPPAAPEGKVLLRMTFDSAADANDVSGFIRRMGTFYQGGKNLAGVVLTAGNCTGSGLFEMVRAYSRAFESTFLLAEPGTELMEQCLKAHVPVGLWLPLCKGILNLRLSIAKAGLERGWEERPVFVYAGRELTCEEKEAARRWHASGADVCAKLGAEMTLRRLMFPKDLTTGGVMPVRLWWQNLGTSPLYREAKNVLVLGQGEERYPICIPGSMGKPGTGDATFNANARLPKLPAGTYTLWCGLEVEGKRIPLAMDAPCKDNLYQVGEVTLDETERPYLERLWVDYYPDAYYPLEDPKEPK